MTDQRTIDLDGPLHYVDHGGDGPPLVLVHGLGGSHINWISVAPALAQRHRVFAIDLPGFGRTAPLGRPATVDGFADIVGRFVAEVAGAGTVVVGNSMGGLVAMVYAAQAAPPPDLLTGLVLVNPASPAPSLRDINSFQAFRLAAPAVPGVGPRMLDRYTSSRSARDLLEETLRLITADPTRVEPQHVDAAVALAEDRRSMPWAADTFSRSSRSIARHLFPRRRFSALVGSIRVPTLLVHGDQDRVVTPAAARRLARLRPDWTYHEFGDVGHVPQIEVPAEFVTVVEAWLSGLPVTRPA